jgi:hypothetical protein
LLEIFHHFDIEQLIRFFGQIVAAILGVFAVWEKISVKFKKNGLKLDGSNSVS